MDPREMDALVQRLVQNPHDQDAILHAHGAGQQDPRAYAMLLEKVGTATADPALASHWLTEAANVWILSLSDAHRAARALMIAIDRDPTAPTPAERLAELYREKGDTKALAALLERRAKALAPLAQRDPQVRAHVAGIHEELARLWADAPLSNPLKAVENYRRALDYDPTSQYAIYAIREAHKSAGQIAEAIPYYAMEQNLVEDTERKVSLYADEAEARRSIGDFDGALQCLENARQVDANDPALKQQLATMVLDRVREGQTVDEAWKALGSQLFVELAEEYPGEHGFAYSTCALEIVSGHDRAVQLAIYYGDQLGRSAEVAPHAASYLKANPNGALAAEARRAAGNSAPRPSPKAVAIAVGNAGPAHVQAAPRIAARRPDAADRTIDDLDSVDDEDDADVESDRGPAADADVIEAMIAKAQQLAQKSRKNEAAGIYRDVLKSDPVNPDALAFLQTHLRQGRKYGDLRDVLLRAARSPEADHESKVAWLREVAGLCESQLRDFDTAITAWQQLLALDPAESQARDQLRRLLERANRWDDLASLLEQEAEQESDVEVRISLEKQLAKLHESKRKDVAAAGQAWARIAQLTPEDDAAIGTAVKLFEKAERPDLAAQVISETVGSVSDDAARAQLYKRLGELRRHASDFGGAGEAFAEAARITQDLASWEAAERAYADAQSWGPAATCANARAELAQTPKQQAALYAVEAEYLSRAGDVEGAIARLDQAIDADPTNQEIAETLEQKLTEADRISDLPALLLRRAEKHPDKAARVELRRRTAKLQRETLGDPAGARESLVLVLEDGDDAEALSLLADDAEERGEFSEAVDYLARLARVTQAKDRRVQVSLRQARLLADGVSDIDAAIEQYGSVLESLDPSNVDALAAIGNLEEQRGRYDAAAKALERHLSLVSAPEQKVELAGRLADIYEQRLDDPKSALRTLNVVHSADPDDFQAVQRIVELAEKLEDWATVADHLARLVEVEGDEEEVSRMTRRLADILHEKLGRDDDALAALAQIGEQGDVECREAFVELGDRLGKKKLVAMRLVEWFGQASASPTRDEHLHGAFERFVEVSADEEAASVAKELARLRIARAGIAAPLEAVSVRLKDLDALAVAHDLVVRDLSGAARAEEMVRQAEVLVRAGVDPLEAVQHGEQALTSVAPDDVEPLLERLGRLLPAPGHVIDLYERQIGRCKAPADRLAALARAAQIAAQHDAIDRARGFFDIALAAGVQEETLETLERIARSTDEARGTTALRLTLAEALAAGGQGSRDGGRTRSALLRRAATLIHRELGDRERAFGWLGDAIVTHVEDAGLDQLVALSQDIGEINRAEVVLTRALGEVFDGPLVRKLLARRAQVRAELLGNKSGAAEDLKRLHELSPSDVDVMEKLSLLYTELEDYRGMVQLFEDQILRGRDQAQRAELARKVARLWEERLDDAREAADAWRRVLRMKSGDPEATAGLERAKANMLKRPSPEDEPARRPEPKVDSSTSGQKIAPFGVSPAKESESVAKAAPAEAAPPAEESEAAVAEGPEATPAEDAAPAADAAGQNDEEPVESAVKSTTQVDQPTLPLAAAEAEPRAEVAPPRSPDEESTIQAPAEVLKAAAASSMHRSEPAPGVNGAARKSDDEADIDVDLSALDGTPKAAPPPIPPAPSARGSLPPPPPRNRNAPPPPPPSMRTSRPPPPPSMRPSRPGPPPPRSGFGVRPGAPQPGASKKAAGAESPPPFEKGEEESEEVVDDDELFE